jgi:DHA1 family inner membrane transport protein
MPLSLLALAISAFAIGTTEFVIMGLLPDVAATFDVSISRAGLLISGYALGIVVGAPLLTAAATWLPRKRVLLLMMVLFIAGNVISALAPTYGALLAGRVVAAVAHGAFFGIGAVVAAGLVAPHRRASAIALMFTGLTAANVLGVPMGTLLGQSFGWRSTFWVVSGLGVISLVGILALVPSAPAGPRHSLRRELAAFGDRQVWLALATTALGFGGVFASFTYISPMMTDVAGFPESAMTWLLVLFGLGLIAGNLVGGRLADRALMPSLYGMLAALTLTLVAFAFTAHSRPGSVITIFVLGFAGFAAVPALQSRVLQKTGSAPTLASAGNIAAFNLGNAIGVWFAGLAIDAGLGYTAPNWVGAGLAAAGLCTALIAGRMDRGGHRRRATVATQGETTA